MTKKNLIFGKRNCAMEIPRGNSREDIKARRQIIKDFYAGWIAEHPEKRVWNKSLKAFIHVKFQSINETARHAALSYESTNAVLHLSDVLAHASQAGTLPRKYNDKNQKPYSRMLLMRWNNFRVIVGFQKSTGEYVQYYVGSK